MSFLELRKVLSTLTLLSFFESALIVAIVVLGGLGSIPGVVVAAILFTVMPEIFRAFSRF